MHENYVPLTVIEMNKIVSEIIDLLYSKGLSRAEVVCIIALLDKFNTINQISDVNKK